MMNLVQALKPKKWKVIFALVPFIFPLFEIWLWIQITLDLYLDVDNFLFDVEEIIGGILYISEITISAPFENLLRPLGWWSRNSLVVAPDGPLLPGSFAVAITYSLLIYVVWSLVSFWRSNQR